MRNLFILNGATPMLVADTLMRTTLAGDENVVIVENIDPDFSRMEKHVVDKKNALPGRDARRAEDMLALTLPVKLRLKCQYPTEYPNFRRRPLTFLREAGLTMATADNLRSQLGGKFDSMFYSGNARLQYALADCAPWRVRLEHGLGDYMYASEGLPLGRIARRWLVSLLTGYWEFTPDEIYLADAGRCLRVPPQSARVKRIAVPDVKGQFVRLCDVLADHEPTLVASLNALRQRAGQFRKTVIYMPLDRFPMEQYEELLDAQLGQVETDGTLFVIKPHPSDPTDYLALFEVRGLSAVRIDHSVGRYLPVEFIAALLPEATLMGVGSSALFYGKWWMGQSVLYAGVGLEDRVEIYRNINTAFAADIAVLGGA